MESIMDDNHISSKDSSNKNAARRVAGMPTIEELKRRVSARQHENMKSDNKKIKKKGTRKKHHTNLEEYLNEFN